MQREAYFDNAKILLIFLVVFGHMIQPFTEGSSGMNTLYMWIYTFHMPAFIFLSGMFAKGSGNNKYIIKLCKKLIIPYIIFQLIYTAFYFFIGKDGWQAGIFYPHWSLWFLFSLFSWHILLVVFKKMPIGISISSSIALGLLVGFFGDVGHTLSLSRTFVFFPFFLTGYWVTKEQFLWLKNRSSKIISVAIMITVAAFIYIAPDFNSGWLLASKSYGDLGQPEFGVFARFLVYVSSTLMALSILVWVPRKENFMTHLGTRTLYVYLLHGFIIQLFREYELFAVNNLLDLLGLAGLSAIIVFFLSSKPVLSIWQPLVEGKATILKYRLQQ